MTQSRSKYVYYEGRMVRRRDLPLWRRVTRFGARPFKAAARRVRDKRLGRWTVKELERTEEAR